MNTNFKVIGLTQLGIEPKSTAPEANAVTARPSELPRGLKNAYDFLRFLSTVTDCRTVYLTPMLLY